MNRHPAISLCDETYFFYYVYQRRQAFGDLRIPANRERVIQRYLATHRVERLGLDRAELTATLMREGQNYRSLFAALLRHYAAQRGKPRFGEKTPQHAIFAETLCDLYPQGKLIHLLRDPRDVVASLLRMPWGMPDVFGNVRTWLGCNRAAQRASRRPNYLLVRYEDVVREPEAELARICDFIGEPYSPAMLAQEESAAVDKWWFERAQKRLTAERLHSWQDELTQEQASLVDWLAGPHLAALGYQPSGRQPGAAAIAAAYAEEAAGRMRHRLRALPAIWYHWMQPMNLAEEEKWIDRPASLRPASERLLGNPGSISH